MTFEAKFQVNADAGYGLLAGVLLARRAVVR